MDNAYFESQAQLADELAAKFRAQGNAKTAEHYESEAARKRSMIIKLPVSILTYNYCTGESQPAKTIDWRNSSDRKWLTNHMTWAINNSCNVILTPAHEITPAGLTPVFPVFA